LFALQRVTSAHGDKRAARAAARGAPRERKPLIRRGLEAAWHAACSDDSRPGSPAPPRAGVRRGQRKQERLPLERSL